MKRGRPKGYTPYTEISYEELADWVGRKTKVPVSKKWLQALMGEDCESNDIDITESNSHQQENADKIEYSITNF